MVSTGDTCSIGQDIKGDYIVVPDGRVEDTGKPSVPAVSGSARPSHQCVQKDLLVEVLADTVTPWSRLANQTIVRCSNLRDQPSELYRVQGDEREVETLLWWWDWRGEYGRGKEGDGEGGLGESHGYGAEGHVPG